jgi:hypothetical protein
MTTSVPITRALVEKFENSFMFGTYFRECVETDKVLRANCFSHEVTINHCNQIVEKFVKSKELTIDIFFRNFVVS